MHSFSLNICDAVQSRISPMDKNSQNCNDQNLRFLSHTKRHSLFAVLLCSRSLERAYMYMHSICPQRWRPKIDSYKIPVRLHKFQETLEDLVEKLEHEIGLVVAQAAQEPDREIDYVRSWIPTMPSLNDCTRALQKVRANFSGHGWFNALQESINDILSLLATWKFWQSKYGKALIRLTLTVGTSTNFLPFYNFYFQTHFLNSSWNHSPKDQNHLRLDQKQGPFSRFG